LLSTKSSSLPPSVCLPPPSQQALFTWTSSTALFFQLRKFVAPKLAS
jgi:hypothetical protein